MKIQSAVQNQDDWLGVPHEYQTEWQRAYRESQESLNLSVPCPVCSVTSLHRWYQVGSSVDQNIEGQKFVATGALWEWCSSCRSFEHYSGLVPDWWSYNLEVDHKKLTALPTALEAAMADLDSVKTALESKYEF